MSAPISANTLMPTPTPSGWISTLWWTNMMPNAAGSMMESAIRKMTIPGMGPHPVARIQCHARRKLVSGRSEKGFEPYEADQNEIDRDNIVQQPRHEQN